MGGGSCFTSIKLKFGRIFNQQCAEMSIFVIGVLSVPVVPNRTVFFIFEGHIPMATLTKIHAPTFHKYYIFNELHSPTPSPSLDGSESMPGQRVREPRSTIRTTRRSVYSYRVVYRN